MRFVVIDGCPVPAPVAEQIRLLKKDVPTAVLQSCDRSRQAGGILKRLHKSTQAALYFGFLRHLPGYNPANPPGRSTHERRSDGVAYRGPIGRPLLSWQVGMDWNDAAVPALIAAARKRGWDPYRPYLAGSEYHHLNFRHRPRIKAQPKAVPAVVVPQASSNVSPAGAHLIASFEGFRSAPYKDAVGVWTIGYGHTDGVGQHTTPLSEIQSQALLRRDLNRVYAPPVRKVAKAVGLTLNQNEFDALVSLVYNVGPGVLDTGRTMGNALSARNRVLIANAFLVYDKATDPSGKVVTLPGLVARRKAERALFLKH